MKTKEELKEYKKKYHQEWKKKYPERYEKKKEYDKKWDRDNKDKVKAKYKRYLGTLKGIVNMIKKKDMKKFGYVSKELNIELIKEVNERDKLCVYCRNDLNKFKIEYDHLNPFLPISKYNLVRCCRECNRSKSSANVLEWCNFKKYIPSNIVLFLLEKQKEVIQ